VSSVGKCSLLILQATPFCNLKCRYCYLPDRDNKARMSAETIRNTFRKFLHPHICADKVTICWHAGEPLVAGIAFYDHAAGLCADTAPATVTVTHSVQTNAVLIDDDWCSFFKRHNFRIGISIDGPKRFHDAQRKTRSGGGTHDAVMNGIRALQADGIEFSAITVLTLDSLSAPDEFFWFYVDNGIRKVGFNIEELEGCNQRSSLFGSGAIGKFKEFMTKMYSLCLQNPGMLSIREFAPDTLVNQNGKFARPANNQNVPLEIISVAANGDFSTFSPELLGYRNPEYGDFIVGNVDRDDVLAALSRPMFERLETAIRAGVEKCRSQCEYFPFCGGGAPANKYFEKGSFVVAETDYCRFTKKTIVDVLLETAEKSPSSSAGHAMQGAFD